MTPARLSVVMPVFNQASLTARCLSSLRDHSRVARQLVVVDNGSSDDTPRLLERFAAELTGQGWTVRAQAFVARHQGKARRRWVSILMLFPRATLDRVGLFDERFFVTYEDTDLRERMDRAGLRYFQLGGCAIWHHSKGTRDREALPSGYEQEGLRLFMEKWGFDPRLREHTRLARLRRWWRKMRARWGLF